MAAAVVTAAILQVVVPHRGRVPIWWLYPFVELALLLLIIAADPGRIDRRSATSRRLTISLIAVMTVANSFGAIVLMYDIVAGVLGMTATDLLGRGALVWVTNVIVFSLWFWELDRGGPAERAAGTPVRPSFAFPEDTMPELAPEGWMPTYPDYLYLSFTNSTAFSPTDTLPVRLWAKMTMMVESAVALVTAILVVARAINVLPG
jgi:hypothetical protein